MITGIKALDNLITKFGIETGVTQNDFQRGIELKSQDRRAVLMKLPYCFYTKIMALEESETVLLHQFALPYRNARLASFLVNQQGQIIEQVYYQRDSKYVIACKKVERLLANNLRPALAHVA